MQIESLKEKMTGLAQTEIVFTSPMQRCRESAQILFPDRERIEIPEWKEMNFGAFEGKIMSSSMEIRSIRHGSTAMVRCLFRKEKAGRNLLTVYAQEWKMRRII